MRLHLLSLTAVVLSVPALARPDEGCCAHLGMQQPAPRRVMSVDPDSGRDLLKYPPSPMVDFQHMALKLTIADMNKPRMEAEQRLTFLPVGTPLTTLVLDARLLEVKSITTGIPAGQRVAFKHDGAKLTITFDPAVPVGQMAEISTNYIVNDPPFGLTWTPESAAWPSRPAQLHSQGQAEYNSYWFPCHDSPNERLTTELTVTVPQGFVVSSNGRLVEPARASQAGPVTYHWLQDKPHVNYLVTLVVGKFDIESVARSGKDRIPMPVHVPPGRGKDIKATYGNTARMIDAFEKRTGQPYPWDQYAQLVVWNFSAGGMENTSATTMYDTAILSREGLADGDLDGLISHELAHQWFGDLLTCASWEHIWLNEGFATYFTNLWWEERDGKDAYLAGVIRQFDSVIAADKADAPFQPAMVSKDFRHPSDAFRKAANPYPKGASVLHMLRAKLGDEVFFRAIAAYVARFKFKVVETGDFRRTLEEVSGESLEQFFAQWCYRPGVPQLDITCEWRDQQSELVISVEQKQNIDGYNPAFAISLPVWVETRSGGMVEAGRIEVAERTAAATFKLPAEPAIVAVDPNLSALAKMKIQQPLRRWLAQLERGPTLAARVQAADTLVTDSSNLAAKVLGKVAADSLAPSLLRQRCVAALGARGDAQTLAEVARAQIKSPDVRESVIDAAAAVLARASKGPDQARLQGHIVFAAAKEESAKVRAAALRAIGVLKLKDQLPVLTAAADVESQHDRVRQGALEGLGSLDAAEGLAIAVRYAQPGTLSRTRPGAIETIGKLAHHNRSAAIPALSRLVADRERRTWQAAGDALVRIGDGSVVPALKSVLGSKPDPADRDRVQAWIDALAKPTAAKP